MMDSNVLIIEWGSPETLGVRNNTNVDGRLVYEIWYKLDFVAEIVGLLLHLPGTKRINWGFNTPCTESQDYYSTYVNLVQKRSINQSLFTECKLDWSTFGWWLLKAI